MHNIDIETLRGYYSSIPGDNKEYDRFIVGEYFQLIILNYLYNTVYIDKITLIGGANLRFIQGIDRFTEDIDFDCKNMSEMDFISMTNDVISYLRKKK